MFFTYQPRHTARWEGGTRRDPESLPDLIKWSRLRLTQARSVSLQSSPRNGAPGTRVSDSDDLLRPSTSPTKPSAHVDPYPTLLEDGYFLDDRVRGDRQPSRSPRDWDGAPAETLKKVGDAPPHVAASCLDFPTTSSRPGPGTIFRPGAQLLGHPTTTGPRSRAASRPATRENKLVPVGNVNVVAPPCWKGSSSSSTSDRYDTSSFFQKVRENLTEENRRKAALAKRRRERLTGTATATSTAGLHQGKNLFNNWKNTYAALYQARGTTRTARGSRREDCGDPVESSERLPSRTGTPAGTVAQRTQTLLGVNGALITPEHAIDNLERLRSGQRRKRRAKSQEELTEERTRFCDYYWQLRAQKEQEIEKENVAAAGTNAASFRQPVLCSDNLVSSAASGAAGGQGVGQGHNQQRPGSRQKHELRHLQRVVKQSHRSFGGAVGVIGSMMGGGKDFRKIRMSLVQKYVQVNQALKDAERVEREKRKGFVLNVLGSPAERQRRSSIGGGAFLSPSSSPTGAPAAGPRGPFAKDIGGGARSDPSRGPPQQNAGVPGAGAAAAESHPPHINHLLQRKNSKDHKPGGSAMLVKKSTSTYHREMDSLTDKLTARMRHHFEREVAQDEQDDSSVFSDDSEQDAAGGRSPAIGKRKSTGKGSRARAGGKAGISASGSGAKGGNRTNLAAAVGGIAARKGSMLGGGAGLSAAGVIAGSAGGGTASITLANMVFGGGGGTAGEDDGGTSTALAKKSSLKQPGDPRAPSSPLDKFAEDYVRTRKILVKFGEGLGD